MAVAHRKEPLPVSVLSKRMLSTNYHMKERIKMFLVDAISRKDIHPYRPFYKDDFIATYGADVFLFLRKNHYINNPARKNCPIWLAWKNPLYPDKTITNLLRNIDNVAI